MTTIKKIGFKYSEVALTEKNITEHMEIITDGRRIVFGDSKGTQYRIFPTKIETYNQVNEKLGEIILTLLTIPRTRYFQLDENDNLIIGFNDTITIINNYCEILHTITLPALSTINMIRYIESRGTIFVSRSDESNIIEYNYAGTLLNTFTTSNIIYSIEVLGNFLYYTGSTSISKIDMLTNTILWTYSNLPQSTSGFSYLDSEGNFTYFDTYQVSVVLDPNGNIIKRRPHDEFNAVPSIIFYLETFTGYVDQFGNFHSVGIYYEEGVNENDNTERYIVIDKNLNIIYSSRYDVRFDATLAISLPTLTIDKLGRTHFIYRDTNAISKWIYIKYIAAKYPIVNPAEIMSSTPIPFAAYDSVNFSITSQLTDARDISFSQDGTKLYVLGNTIIYQYTLSTPWAINTANYDNINFNTTTQTNSANAINFKPDGTKLYVICTANRRIYQYTLSTPWNINTANFDTVDLNISSNGGFELGLFFKPDGTKMYYISSVANLVYQYTLSTPWAINTANYDNVSFNTIAQATDPNGLFFKSDGTRMIIFDYNTSSVYQYQLSTAWDIGTATYDDISFSISSQTTNSRGLFFKSDGTKMYVLAQFSDGTIYQYTVETSIPPIIETNRGNLLDIFRPPGFNDSSAFYWLKKRNDNLFYAISNTGVICYDYNFNEQFSYSFGFTITGGNRSAVDNNNNLYIVNGSAVYKYDSLGNPQGSVDTGISLYYAVYDSINNLIYFQGTGSLYKIDTSLTILNTIATATVGNIAVTPDGNIIIASSTSTVYKYNTTTGDIIWSASYSSIVPNNTSFVSDILIDSNEDIYILYSYNFVLKIDSLGNLLVGNGPGYSDVFGGQFDSQENLIIYGATGNLNYGIIIDDAFYRLNKNTLEVEYFNNDMQDLYKTKDGDIIKSTRIDPYSMIIHNDFIIFSVLDFLSTGESPEQKPFIKIKNDGIIGKNTISTELPVLETDQVLTDDTFTRLLSENISGLKPNTTYAYRAIVREFDSVTNNQVNEYESEIMYFKTDSGALVKTLIGGQWIQKPLKTNKAGTWIEPVLKVYKNGVWVEI